MRAKKQDALPGTSIKNLIGQKFGRLTVVAFAGIDRRGNANWKCRCDCDGEKITSTTNLKTGRVMSCTSSEDLGLRGFRHGATKGHSLTTEYKIWSAMLQRCSDPNGPDWMRYGGRGILVCPQWRSSYLTFLAEVGKRPSPKHSLDRIEVDGNYGPGNVRWATAKTQARNRTSTRFIEFEGEKLCLAEWSERKGFGLNVLARRIDAGWSIQRSLTTPSKKKPRTKEARGFEYGEGI
jgi:hypothetical protein